MYVLLSFLMPEKWPELRRDGLDDFDLSCLPVEEVFPVRTGDVPETIDCRSESEKDRRRLSRIPALADRHLPAIRFSSARQVSGA